MMFKSVEELQYEINELKRKLNFVLNENQMLRVKYRKLETATLSKDKKIEYLMNPIKNYQMRRIVADNGSSIIYNLQKRNKELEEILSQKDALNRKYHNEVITTRLYSSRIQVEGCRKRGRASLQASQTPLVSPIADNAKNPPMTSLQDHYSWESHDRKNDAGNDNDTMPLSIGSRSIFTTRNSKIESRETEDPEKLLAIIQSLKEIVQSFKRREFDARNTMHLKNLELENLTVELRGIRSRLNRKNRKPISHDRRSSSTGSLPQESKCSSSSFLASISPKSKVPCRQRSVLHNAVPPCDRDIKPGRQKCLETFEARQISLEAVVEQSEDITLDVTPEKELEHYIVESDSLVQDLSSSIEESAMNTDPQSKLEYSKTEIEYSIDSEVSSDGEEVFVIQS